MNFFIKQNIFISCLKWVFLFLIQKHIIKSENIVAHGEELRCHLNYSSIKSPIAEGKHLESLLFLFFSFILIILRWYLQSPPPSTLMKATSFNSHADLLITLLQKPIRQGKGWEIVDIEKLAGPNPSFTFCFTTFLSLRSKCEKPLQMHLSNKISGFYRPLTKWQMCHHENITSKISLTIDFQIFHLHFQISFNDRKEYWGNTIL